MTPRCSSRRLDRLLALSVLGFLAGSGSVQADVLINEFLRSGGVHQVELYNAGADTVDVTGWTIVNGDSSLGYTLSGVIPPNDYLSRTVPGLVLDGGQIELFDGTTSKDHVAYGDEGGAPAPPIVGNYSCGRSPNGIDTGDHASDWNLDSSQTLGAANDHASADLGSEILINELGRTAGATRGGCGVQPTFELYNPFLFDVVLAGWLVSDGRKVLSLFGPIDPMEFRVFVDDGCTLDFEATGVLYLFDPFGARVDQVGTRGASLPPILDNHQSFQRVPDGAFPFGPYDGYDYVTTGGSLVWVIKPETFGFTNGTGPVTSAGREVDHSTWGRLKSLYR